VSSRAVAGRDLLLILAGCSLLFVSFLGARDLWNPNEPIYGQAVREMAAADAWLLPTVNGEPFAEKTILYFWLARGSAIASGRGVDELSLRLPSALSGVLAVAAVYLLVTGSAGRRRALLASGVLATTYIVWWGARSVQMDLLLTALNLAAVLAAYRTLQGKLAPWVGWPLTGLVIGLAVLAKGPVAVFVFAVPLVIYAQRSGRIRQLGHPAVLGAGGAALLVAAPWFLALWLAGGGGHLYEMLFRQNVTRSLVPWDHAAPWWYYLREFWIDMAPWSLFIPLAARLPQRDSGERELDRLAWIWILVVVALFSLAASKRSPYILPVAPAVAILVSGVLDRWLRARLERWRDLALVAIALVVGLVLAVGGVMIWRAVPSYPLLGNVGLATALLLMGGGSLLLVGLPVYIRLRATLPIALLVILGSVYLSVGGWALPRIDVYKSPRPFCEQVQEWVAPEDPLRTYRTWRWRAGYTYYLDRPLPRVDSPRELREYWRSAGRVFLIVERGMLEELRQTLGDTEPLVVRDIGSNRAYLFSNQPHQ
jgi:4-amino-4-deoxy-L-arabinose transferase-like glycosyltransferase